MIACTRRVLFAYTWRTVSRPADSSSSTRLRSLCVSRRGEAVEVGQQRRTLLQVGQSAPREQASQQHGEGAHGLLQRLQLLHTPRLQSQTRSSRLCALSHRPWHSDAAFPLFFITSHRQQPGAVLLLQEKLFVHGDAQPAHSALESLRASPAQQARRHCANDPQKNSEKNGGACSVLKLTQLRSGPSLRPDGARMEKELRGGGYERDRPTFRMDSLALEAPKPTHVSNLSSMSHRCGHLPPLLHCSCTWRLAGASA